MSETSLLQAAAEVVQLAGGIALGYFRAPTRVETKIDGSPVTVADREAEHAARAWIEKHFPEDGILGEELGHVRPKARRCWLLDPIDGTKTFVRGVPLWGSLAAVAEGEQVIAGAAFFPAVGEILVAGAGLGCRWNGIPCSVSTVADLSRATVLTTSPRFVDPQRRQGWQELSRRAEVSRTWGDCYGYLMVATGRAEVMVDPIVSPWDTAAVLTIIEEAGGVFTDWSGKRTAFGGSAVATNGRLAHEARRVLGAGVTVPSGAPSTQAEE